MEMCQRVKYVYFFCGKLDLFYYLGNIGNKNRQCFCSSVKGGLTDHAYTLSGHTVIKHQQSFSTQIN